MSKVLIIEDEIETAEPVREALALENIDSDIAKNGGEGMKLFRENEYDLVLLDLKMPGMDGEDVLKAIRETDPFVDVVVYTNYSEFTDIKKLTNIGIQGYFNKGSAANLPELIAFILNRLAPLSDESLEKLIYATPAELFSEK